MHSKASEVYPVCAAELSAVKAPWFDRPNAAGLAFLLLVFAGLILQLHEEWSLNPQYAYGWGVPILGALLFRDRWRDRPLGRPSGHATWLPIAAIGVIALWLPLRLAREANMDWRLLQWMAAGSALALILGTLHWMGGRNWLRHFGFAAGFILVAVPWPTRLEHLLVQGSTEVVVRGAVEALRWMGYAAWSAGNVIQLPGTAVGVDEACSGLRSFQGAVMCALFLGELKRLSWPRRAALLACGAFAALALNFLRTTILTRLAASGGTAAVEMWHDRTGLGTLIAAFLLLWLLAQQLGRNSKSTGEVSETRGVRGVPTRFVFGCAVWFLAVEAASRAWFGSAGGQAPGGSWQLHAGGVPGMAREAIPARVQAILKFDQGQAYRRKLPDGTEWWIYSIGWSPQGGGAPLARFHSPEVCLPAAGLKLAERGGLIHPLGEELPFRWYRFDWRKQPVFLFSAFYSSTQTGAIQSMDEFDLTWRKRLAMAWAGQRPAEQKVFQVLISGSASDRAAREAFEQFARQCIRKEAGAS